MVPIRPLGLKVDDMSIVRFAALVRELVDGLPELDAIVAKVDRCHAAGFGEEQERPRREALRIAKSKGAGGRMKQLKLSLRE